MHRLTLEGSMSVCEDNNVVGATLGQGTEERVLDFVSSGRTLPSSKLCTVGVDYLFLTSLWL